MHREHMISFNISLRSCAIRTFHGLELISASVLTYILAMHACVAGSWQHKISFLSIISHHGMLVRYFLRPCFDSIECVPNTDTNCIDCFEPFRTFVDESVYFSISYIEMRLRHINTPQSHKVCIP